MNAEDLVVNKSYYLLEDVSMSEVKFMYKKLHRKQYYFLRRERRILITEHQLWKVYESYSEAAKVAIVRLRGVANTYEDCVNRRDAGETCSYIPSI